MHGVAYQPEKLYARYQYQCDYTYAKRLKVPVTPRRRAGPISSAA
jgi:hypothetical protein